jgi:hypothetical protein
MKDKEMRKVDTITGKSNSPLEKKVKTFISEIEVTANHFTDKDRARSISIVFDMVKPQLVFPLTVFITRLLKEEREKTIEEILEKLDNDDLIENRQFGKPYTAYHRTIARSIIKNLLNKTV